MSSTIRGEQNVQKVKNQQVSLNEHKPSRYMPGLDGLRALAVFAVIAYHLNFAWAPGGLLGVCLFFVLSGYLITDLLVMQWKLSGSMDLTGFWLRRARRLLPALYAMLAGVMAWTALFAPARLASSWQDGLAAVFYISNWWFIFHHVSYFASFGPLSPFGHLWSLAVEEQFYLVWPLLLWLGLRFVPSRRRLVGLTLVGVLASAIAMALLYQPGMDPSRVYYGTDTRAFALLMGAVLAMVWPSRKLSATLPLRSSIVLDLVGGIGLLVVLLMIWQSNEYEEFLYRGGLLLFSVAATVLVAVLAHPASRLGKSFAWPPLRWLGVCSYGIYLWHYPVIALTSPAVNTSGPDLLVAFGQVVASIVLAALSWRFIEEPVRNGAWRRPWQQLRSSKRWSNLVAFSGKVTLISVLWVLGASCLVIIGGLLILNAKHADSPAPVIPSSQANEVRIEGQASGKLNTVSRSHIQVQAGTASARKPGSGAPVTAEIGKGVTVIGDSVMVGVEPVLKKLLPGIVVDAKIGRQMYQATSTVAQLKAQGELGKRVIIELGTNGAFTEEQLTTLLRSLGQAQQIVLVNTRVPRPWEGVVNQTLAQEAATYPHTTLVNWYSASSNHNAYFYPDGVHLNSTGIQAYAALVVNVIKPQAAIN
ncbi:MAG: acyltransferase family protein [Peptococcaceae bacterium]|nr:acyltransferase family protein [Peptococcaceae bacterium]